jgi:hypothetical protein
MHNNYTQWIEECDIDITDTATLQSLQYVVVNLTSNNDFSVTKNQHGTLFLEKITESSPIRLYMKGQIEVQSFISGIQNIPVDLSNN